MKLLSKLRSIVLLVTTIIVLALCGCTALPVTTLTTVSMSSILATTTETATTTEQTIALTTTSMTTVSAQPTLTTSTATTSTKTTAIGEILLPVPVIAKQSVEICLNSRESAGNLTGTLTTQQLSNILWAVGKAPMVGPTREITVATQAGQFGPGTGGTYSYNPDSHSLTKVSDTLTDEGAFKISWDLGQNGLTFDAGLIYMPSLLAAVSSWGSSSRISCWPKDTNTIVFGSDSSLTLNEKCVAISSVPPTAPSYLPNPSTTGTDNLADVMANLKYTNKFNQTNLTLQQISQLLWAGYGCTPHKDPKGITVPSALDQLYLTGTIYLVNENGVFRYQNRQPTDNFFTNPGDPSGFFNTKDHRLEQIGSSDVRASLQSAVSGLPQAPCYIILSLDDVRLQNFESLRSDISPELIKTYANLEPGFVAFNYLLQASAMELGCNFKTQLTSSEQGGILSVTNIPSADQPLVVVSVGGVGK